MTNNAADICAELKQIIDVWCFPDNATKKRIEEIQPFFITLTKILSKPISQVHGVSVLGKKEIHVSPLLPTLFVLNYHVRALAKKFFTFNKGNYVFKQGVIRPATTVYK
jgi:hypothetical protein